MPEKSLPELLQTLWKYLQLSKRSIRQKPVVILIYRLLSIQIVAASMFQMRGVRPQKGCSEAIPIVVILTIMPASNLSIPQSKENGLTDSISLTINMPIDLYSSTLKPFIIPLGFTVTATICLLMTLKKCMRGYVLCRQLSCQNFSFYFVLNLDTGPPQEIAASTTG